MVDTPQPPDILAALHKWVKKYPDATGCRVHPDSWQTLAERFDSMTRIVVANPPQEPSPPITKITYMGVPIESDTMVPIGKVWRLPKVKRW